MRGFFCAFAPAAGRAATGGCGPRAAGAEGGRQAIFQKIMTSPRAPTRAREGLFEPAEGRGGLRAFASFKFSAGERPARAAHRATAVRCGGPHPLCLAPAMRRKRAGSVNKIQTFPQKMSRKRHRKAVFDENLQALVVAKHPLDRPIHGMERPFHPMPVRKGAVEGEKGRMR